MTLGAGAGTPGPGLGASIQGGGDRMPGRLLGSHSHAQAQRGTVNGGGGASGGWWGRVRSCQARRELAPLLAALRPAFGTPLATYARPRWPLPRAASQCAAWPPCLDCGKGWRWGWDAGLWAGRGAAMPAMPGACLSLRPSPGWGQRLQQTPASPHGGLEVRATIAAAATAAVACAAETRLEIGELTLASQGTRFSAPPSTPSYWPSASISALPAQPPSHGVRAPTAHSLPERDPWGRSGSPGPGGWGRGDREVRAGCQGDYWAPTPPLPGLQGNCEQRAGGSGGGMGWGPEPGSLAGANTSSRLARPPLDTPLAPHTLPVGGPSPAPRPRVHPGGLDWRRKGWRWGREAGMWARRWAARSAMPGACLSLHQSPKWGERLQQTPASARRGLKGRAAIAAAAAAAAVACAAENRLEMDSAGARDGVRGCSRRQYLPAGASRAAQPSPTLLLLPPLLRPGWRWAFPQTWS
ncbi:uncharacterized protein LOC122236316 isoform X4 [Panthera tigris]|uniref:uncharacterized protein LOC122236316 isoform X4 n=1 Tax=Panthera tigris TaxID=9694 RepID=UPI001C6FC202|nr:uncharacterized protein LOC122236316 isoform X4 [Panthera tigris]